MALQIVTSKLFLCGTVSGGLSHAFIEYEIREGAAYECLGRTEIWEVQNPNWSKKVDQFMEDELSAIKTAEGIS